MILFIKQTKSNFDMEWEISSATSSRTAIAKAPFTIGKFETEITYDDSSRQTLYFNPSNKTWGSNVKDLMSFKVLVNQNKVGSIVGGQYKKVPGFLQSYNYYEFVLENEVYYGYEVGFGKKGLYLCIYKGEELVAIVQKNLKVVNYKDSYVAYLEDEKYMSVVVPFSIYYDVTAYGDVMEWSVLSVKEKRVNSTSKELRSKYDADFIKRVIDKE